MGKPGPDKGAGGPHNHRHSNASRGPELTLHAGVGPFSAQANNYPWKESISSFHRAMTGRCPMASSFSTLRHLQTLLSTEAARLRSCCPSIVMPSVKHFFISIAGPPEVGSGGAILQIRFEVLPSSVFLGFPNLVRTALMHQAF